MTAEFLDLPAEVISIIGSNLTVKELRNIKTVCLSNQLLYNRVYNVIKDDISKRDVLKIHLRGDSKSERFLVDYDFLMNSSIRISLKLPTQQSKVENLKPKIVEMINVYPGRISQIKINFDNPIDLLQLILHKCKQLEKIVIVSNWTIPPQLIQNMINNNCTTLQYLNLFYMTFTVDFKFNQMSKLKELKLYDCRGDASIQSLLSRQGVYMSS